MAQTFYKGVIDDNGQAQVVKQSGDRVERLALSELARAKSPEGFGWGYDGRGPEALAHSLLADVVGPRLADELYQDFKGSVVLRFNNWSYDTPGVKWELTRTYIQGWVSRHAPGLPLASGQ